MAKSKDGFLKYVVASLGEDGGKLAFDAYVADGSHQEKRDLANTLHEIGVEVDHPGDTPSVSVADNIAAREAREAEAAKARKTAAQAEAKKA